MQAKFTATQAVSIPVPQAPISIKHYLRQPQRLIYSLIEPSQTQQLSEDCFRVKMRSRQFMMLTLQPIVDIKIWTDPSGILYLKAIRCELRELDFVNQRFELRLNGTLQLDGNNLDGQADLEVRVELPPVLWMTPKPIINAAGTGMLKSILASVKHRLVQQIIKDYIQWANSVESKPDSQTRKTSQVLPRTL